MINVMGQTILARYANYNMQIGLTGRPNMVSTLDERSPPLALKNGGSITNFVRHLSIFLSA